MMIDDPIPFILNLADTSRLLLPNEVNCASYPFGKNPLEKLPQKNLLCFGTQIKWDNEGFLIGRFFTDNGAQNYPNERLIIPRPGFQNAIYRLSRTRQNTRGLATSDYPYLERAKGFLDRILQSTAFDRKYITFSQRIEDALSGRTQAEMGFVFYVDRNRTSLTPGDQLRLIPIPHIKTTLDLTGHKFHLMVNGSQATQVRANLVLHDSVGTGPICRRADNLAQALCQVAPVANRFTQAAREAVQEAENGFFKKLRNYFFYPRYEKNLLEAFNRHLGQAFPLLLAGVVFFLSHSAQASEDEIKKEPSDVDLLGNNYLRMGLSLLFPTFDTILTAAEIGRLI